MDLAHYIAFRLRRWRKENFPYKTHKKRFGAEGELIAANYLRKQHFRILYKNFRPPSGGEIDLVCRDCKESCLVFIEVKRRLSSHFGAPSLAVRREKQRLLVRGASAWLQLLNHPPISCRFDIIEITGKESEIRHIRNAFPVPHNHL